MSITAFGHQLETIHDGLTILKDGRPAPVPLSSTDVSVEIKAGLAIIRTRRSFTNAERRPIEAILTMPVGFDAVVTGMVAEVDGRRLRAKAADVDDAREQYEDAIARGKLSVLHEEVLRGVHMLSVGQLGAGKQVVVELETVMPLAIGKNGPFLRIPVTVGQLYGNSPLAVTDDLIIATSITHQALLKVSVDTGSPVLYGNLALKKDTVARINLDRAIEIEVLGGSFGSHQGTAADGKAVTLDLRQTLNGDQPLNLAVLIDRSGSTGSPHTPDNTESVHTAIQRGAEDAFKGLRPDDKVSLWQFSATCDFIGTKHGPDASHLMAAVALPAGGTELGLAIKSAIAAGQKDILVLTDGQTWEGEVDTLTQSQARISAILIGSGSLDANIGALCAYTGGQVFYAQGGEVGATLETALAALRLPATHAQGKLADGKPRFVVAVRGGVAITAQWTDALSSGGLEIGRYAAALALPLLEWESADAWAQSHSLCTHRTSLILVDELGAVSEGMPDTRKIPLMEKSASDLRAFSPSFRISQASASDYVASAREKIYDLRDMEPPVWSFDGFDWLIHSDRLLNLDFHILSENQAKDLEIEKVKNEVARLSSHFNLDATLVALALIAWRSGDRNAKRFARKVMRGVPVSEWQ